MHIPSLAQAPLLRHVTALNDPSVFVQAGGGCPAGMGSVHSNTTSPPLTVVQNRGCRKPPKNHLRDGQVGLADYTSSSPHTWSPISEKEIKSIAQESNQRLLSVDTEFLQTKKTTFEGTGNLGGDVGKDVKRFSDQSEPSEVMNNFVKVFGTLPPFCRKWVAVPEIILASSDSNSPNRADLYSCYGALSQARLYVISVTVGGG